MYGFNVTIDATMEEAETKVRDALAVEGFGVLTEIDVQKVMKAKLDIDRTGYKILGACNPNLANEAIQAEPDIGLLLPCNVLLREEDGGKVNVSFMDPVAVLGMVDNPKIAEVAPLVQGKLKNVAANL
ncbi:MAG: DUF302 domain-containing protein [Gammaproteobacteria bacterium]|nr:DUF302 domain-containing protein [Gammaproteobacteria bacterium]MCW9048599.1 DUF302 domain-containing protein [Gammaproteobacteria bacterium]